MAYEDYEPVAARLDRWLAQVKEQQTRVITHMISDAGADICVFRAELYLGDTLIATGWAEEIRNSNHITKTSHVEVCETSSLGRALANAGLAGSDWTKRASREEMQKADRYGESTPATKRPFTETKTIVNKMPGKCGRCGMGVDTRQGKAVNDGSGWKTFHNEGQCPTDSVEEPF